MAVTIRYQDGTTRPLPKATWAQKEGNMLRVGSPDGDRSFHIPTEGITQAEVEEHGVLRHIVACSS